MSIHLKKCLIQLTISDESRRASIEQTIIQLVKNTLSQLEVDGLSETSDTVLNLDNIQVDLPVFNENELTSQFNCVFQPALVKAIKESYQNAKNSSLRLIDNKYKLEHNYQLEPGNESIGNTVSQETDNIHSIHWAAITQRLLFNTTTSQIELTDIQGNSVFSTLLLNCLQAQPHYIKPLKHWLKSQLVRYRLIDKLTIEERVRLIDIIAHPLLTFASELRDAQTALHTQAAVYWSSLLYYASADAVENVPNGNLCQSLLLKIKLDSLRLVTATTYSANHSSEAKSAYQGSNVFNLAKTTGHYTATRLFQSIKQRLHQLLSQHNSLSEKEWYALKTTLLLRTEATIDHKELNTLAALIQQMEQCRQTAQPISQENTTQHNQQQAQHHQSNTINYQQDITDLEQLISQLRALSATSDNPLFLNQQLEKLNQLLASQSVCDYNTVQQLQAWLAQVATHYGQLTIDQLTEQLDRVIKRMTLLLSPLVTKKW